MRYSYNTEYAYSEMNAFRRLRKEKAENEKKESGSYSQLEANDLKSKMTSYVKSRNNYREDEYLE